MNCFECDNTKDCIVVSENNVCPHCNEVITVDFNMCDQCGLLWKSVGSEILEKTVFRLPPETLSLDNLKGYFYDMGIVPITDETYEEIRVNNHMNNNIKSMSDFIHKCLKCGGYSYEYDTGLFRCVECDFEWEVVDG